MLWREDMHSRLDFAIMNVVESGIEDFRKNQDFHGLNYVLVGLVSLPSGQ